MKKLVSAVPAAALIASGLVAGVSAPASAVCDPDYAGCIETSTKITDKQGDRVGTKGSRPVFNVRVKPVGGSANVDPSGTVRVKFTHWKSGETHGDMTVRASYEGGTVTVKPGDGFSRKGRWIVDAKFKGDHPFYNSSDQTAIRILAR